MSSSSGPSVRMPWSLREEEILVEAMSSGNFTAVYPTIKHKFHPSRTMKALRTHYYRLRSSGRLPSIKAGMAAGGSAATPPGSGSRGVKRPRSGSVSSSNRQLARGLPDVDSLSPLDAFTLRALLMHVKSTRQETFIKRYRPLLLRMLEHSSNGGVFNTPVDSVALQLPDYSQIVQRPMDLGTVRQKLETGAYSTAERFAADVVQTFDNAIAYNPKPHPVHMAALRLKEEFAASLKRLHARVEAEDERKRSHNCSFCQGQVCVICGCKCLRYDPPVLHCDCCGEKVKRGATYYRNPVGQRWCVRCISTGGIQHAGPGAALPPTAAIFAALNQKALRVLSDAVWGMTMGTRGPSCLPRHPIRGVSTSDATTSAQLFLTQCGVTPCGNRPAAAEGPGGMLLPPVLDTGGQGRGSSPGGRAGRPKRPRGAGNSALAAALATAKAMATDAVRAQIKSASTEAQQVIVSVLDAVGTLPLSEIAKMLPPDTPFVPGGHVSKAMALPRNLRMPSVLPLLRTVGDAVTLKLMLRDPLMVHFDPTSWGAALCMACVQHKKNFVSLIAGMLRMVGLEKRKNDDVVAEPWVQCDKCAVWCHQICALFNARKNALLPPEQEDEVTYHCPACQYVAETDAEEGSAASSVASSADGELSALDVFPLNADLDSLLEEGAASPAQGERPAGARALAAPEGSPTIQGLAALSRGVATRAAAGSNSASSVGSRQEGGSGGRGAWSLATLSTPHSSGGAGGSDAVAAATTAAAAPTLLPGGAAPSALTPVVRVSAPLLAAGALPAATGCSSPQAALLAAPGGSARRVAMAVRADGLAPAYGLNTTRDVTLVPADTLGVGPADEPVGGATDAGSGKSRGGGGDAGGGSAAAWCSSPHDGGGASGTGTRFKPAAALPTTPLSEAMQVRVRARLQALTGSAFVASSVVVREVSAMPQQLTVPDEVRLLYRYPAAAPMVVKRTLLVRGTGESSSFVAAAEDAALAMADAQLVRHAHQPRTAAVEMSTLLKASVSCARTIRGLAKDVTECRGSTRTAK